MMALLPPPVAGGTAVVRVRSTPAPFQPLTLDFTFPAGGTIAELVALSGIDHRIIAAAPRFVAVQLADAAGRHEPAPVPPTLWHAVRPKADTVLWVAMRPRGAGGGGGGKKSAFGFIAAIASFALPMIVPLAAGPMLFGGVGLWGALARGAGFLLGQVAQSGASKPPTLSASVGSFSGATTRSSPSYSITGIGNRANRYGPVPVIYGRVRLYPPLAARQFTESQGQETYLRALFCVGYGPVKISELRIGTVPIEQFNGVEIEIREGRDSDDPISLYSRTILEDQHSLQVTRAGGPEILVTRDAADEIVVDLTFQGLVTFAGDGSLSNRSVRVTVEYRRFGSSDPWIEASNETYTANTQNAYRQGVRILPGEPARYELRFTRNTADGGTSVRDTLFITAVRTVRYDNPINMPGLALVALRILGTNQLSGQIGDFNCLAERYVQVWTGSAWVEQLSRLPAWAYVDVLRGRANQGRVADDRIILDDFREWANDCIDSATGKPLWTFDKVLDSHSTVRETLARIASSVRASPALVGGRHTVVRPRIQQGPVQLFTPRNTWGNKGTRTWSRRPHALRVRYTEPKRDWQEDEVIVYRAGHGESNATLFEVLKLDGCTDREMAIREGKYYFAVADYQPEGWEFQCDIENLAVRRGQRAQYQWDVALIGQVAARVRDLTLDEDGWIAAITLDEQVVMEAGRAYGLRCRRGAGRQVIVAIETATGVYHQIALPAPVAPAAGPAIGDLVAFGETDRESIAVLVKSVTPGPDFTARIEVIPYDERLLAADVVIGLDYDPVISFPVDFESLPPPKPEVAGWRSDETAARLDRNRLVFRIGLTLAAPAGGWPIERVRIRWRRLASGDPWQVREFVDLRAELMLEPVESAETYEIGLTYINREGTPSEERLASHFVIGKTSRPPDVTNITVDGHGIATIFADLPIDFDGYLLRHHAGDRPTWAGATPMHPNSWPAAQFNLNSLPAGARTVMVKLVDTSGNESARAYAFGHDVGDDTDRNVVAEVDLRALGFPGRYSGGAIEAGDLVAVSGGDGAIFTGDPENPIFTGDPANAVFGGRYAPLVYDFTLTAPADAVPSQLRFDWKAAGSSVQLDWRPPGGKPIFTGRADRVVFTGDPENPIFAGPLPFEPFPGAADVSSAAFQFRLTIPGGSEQARIDRLVARFDVDDERENGQDLVVPVGGIRLPLRKAYRAGIPLQIRATAVSSATGTGVSIEIVDRRPQSASIRVVDADRIDVGGVVDWDVAGARHGTASV